MEDPGPLLFRALAPGADLAPLGGSQVYALCDLSGCAGEPPAATVVTRPGPREGTMEVCAVTVCTQMVASGRRGCELGDRLLAEVAHAHLASGLRRLVASAADSDTERLAMLDRAGFRPDPSVVAGDEDDDGRRWFSREL